MKADILTTSDPDVPDELWINGSLLARDGEITVLELSAKLLLLGIISADDVETTHHEDISFIEMKSGEDD